MSLLYFCIEVQLIYNIMLVLGVQQSDSVLCVCVCVCVCCAVLSYSVISDSLWPQGLQPARLLCPWNFPGKNTGLGCYFLLQEYLPNLGIEPMSPVLAGRFFTPASTGKSLSLSLSLYVYIYIFGLFPIIDYYKTLNIFTFLCYIVILYCLSDTNYYACCYFWFKG